MIVKNLVGFRTENLMELSAHIQRVTAVMDKMLRRRRRALEQLRNGESVDLERELTEEDRELAALVADLDYNRSN